VTTDDDGHYAELAERARTLYTGAVLDVLDELGVKDCVLPSELTLLGPEMRFCGPAFPVEGRSHPEMDWDRSMRAILEMLGAVRAQHVVVYQPHDSTSSHLGELSVTALKVRRCVGAVIDGGCRDIGHSVAEGSPENRMSSESRQDSSGKIKLTPSPRFSVIISSIVCIQPHAVKSRATRTMA
jgi:hypothetical protein